MSRPVQLHLTPLPPTVLETIARYDATVERARLAAEAVMVEAVDFDAQKATGTWPVHVFDRIHAPARSELMGLVYDYQRKDGGCREDLLDEWQRRQMTHLGLVSPKWEAWFRAAYDRSHSKGRLRAAGSLFQQEPR